MNAKKQIKKMVKAVERNPVAISAIVTGALAVVGTTGMMMKKVKIKKITK